MMINIKVWSKIKSTLTFQGEPKLHEYVLENGIYVY